MKRIKNKNPGAKVIVWKVLLSIKPKEGWKYAKNVSGTIVERGNYEHYYHTCSGTYTHIIKHIINNNYTSSYAIKLDNDLKDIEGNNIIVVNEDWLKFIDYLPAIVKVISKKQYESAKKLIEKYNEQQKLK